MEQDNGLDNKKLVKEKIDFYVNDTFFEVVE